MSTFQQQYPLSPRKIWKKMAGSIILCTISFFIFGSMAWFAAAQLQDEIPEATTVIEGIVVAYLVLTVSYLLLRAWYWRTYIARYFYDASGDFITIRKGVFAPREIHVQWQKIQDVYVDQDVVDRFMGLYDVHIASATAASGMEAHIDGVDEATATALKNYFLNRLVGGSQTPTSSAPAPSASPEKITFTGSISSTEFPIQSAYTTRRVIGIILSSMFVSLFLSAWISGSFMDIASDPVTFLIILCVIAIFYITSRLIAFFIWKKNYRFAFTPEFIYLHTGVISKSEKHVPYRTVQDVTISQSVLDRMFGLANVIIENAAAGVIMQGRSAIAANKILIPGQTPEAAQKISEALRSVVLTKNSSGTGL